MSGLPLALTQAGAYLRQTGMSVREYVECYDKTWSELMEEHHEDPQQEYAQRSVLTTWSISYEQVRRQRQEAANLLKLWAFLDCGDVWFELIACAADGELSIEMPPWLLSLTRRKLHFRSTLGLLLRYSLAEVRSEGSSYTMHPVLHKWCYHMCSTDGDEGDLCWLAARLVGQTVPSEDDKRYWELQRRLLPHGRQLSAMLSRHAIPIEVNDSAWIFHELGRLFQSQNIFFEGEKMYVRALEGREKALGAEHTSKLDPVNNLGLLYADQGKHGRRDRPMKLAFLPEH